MQKTIKPLINISALALFFTFMGVASLTLGYIYADRKPVGPLKVVESGDLQKKIGGVIAINVLSRKTFDDGHIAGSVNIPLNNLRSKARQLFDKDQHLVVYCASMDCHASQKAAQTLSRSGFKNVYAYEGGMKDWYTKKLPSTGPCTMKYLNGNCSSIKASTKVCKVSRVTSKKRVKSSKKSKTHKKSTKKSTSKKSIKQGSKSKKHVGVTSVKAKKQQRIKTKRADGRKTSKTSKTRTSPRGKALKKKQTTQKKKNKHLESLIVTSPKPVVEKTGETAR